MIERGISWQVEAKERRRFLRVPVDMSAMLVSSALGRVTATVTDLSQSGCRIRSRVRCHRGDHLVVTIGSFSPKCVTAAWWSEDEIGLAFSEPLAWAVVAEIAGHGREPAPGGTAFGIR